MDGEKRKPGRPRKYAGTRPTWTVRLPAALGEEIVASAKAEGRSISEELELRIIKGTEYKERWHDMQLVFGESTIDYANAVIKKNIEVALLQYGYSMVQVLGEFLWVRPGADVQAISRHLHLANSIKMPDDSFIKALGEEIALKLKEWPSPNEVTPKIEVRDNEG